MNPLIVMGLIALVPVALILVTRTKAAFVFMALTVGFALSSFVGDQALDMVQLFTRSYSQSTQTAVQIGLIAAPVLLTILFLSKTVTAAKVLFNIPPAMLTGITALFMIAPLLPDVIQNDVYGTSLWDQLVKYQPMLIGAGAFLCLLQMWATGASLRHKRRERHKKNK